jgi:hypothetical protein
MGDLWGTIDRSGWRNAPHMGNGVCLFDELEFIDETDPQFTEGVV